MQETAMAETTTITVRVPLGVREQLDRLAELTKRTRSFHAAEALAAYASSELGIVESIQRGIDDADAGRTIPHKQAMAQLRATVRKAAARAAKRSA
jgi:predicted transcriptional regulator